MFLKKKLEIFLSIFIFRSLGRKGATGEKGREKEGVRNNVNNRG